MGVETLKLGSVGDGCISLLFQPLVPTLLQAHVQICNDEISVHCPSWQHDVAKKSLTRVGGILNYAV
jgi:hypothetical protein